MTRTRRMAIVLTGTLVLVVFIGLPILLSPAWLSPLCPVAVARAQDNPCAVQEATNDTLQGQLDDFLRTDVAQVEQIEQLQSTLSFHTQLLELVRTDVALNARVLELESTLAVAGAASTLMRVRATPSASVTPEPVMASTLTGGLELPQAGGWSYTVEGDCVQGPGTMTVSFEGEQMILSNELATTAYEPIAPGVYQYEEETDTYALRSTVTVIDPTHMESEVISRSGGSTFTCHVQMALEDE